MSRKKNNNYNSVLIPSTKVSGLVGNLVIQKNGYIRLYVKKRNRKSND